MKPTLCSAPRSVLALLLATSGIAGCSDDAETDPDGGGGSGAGASQTTAMATAGSTATVGPSTSSTSTSVASSSTGIEMVCTPASIEACYDGPPGTDGTGACTAGMRTCSDDGAAWGPCLGQVLPTPESCSNPGDEDCDGAVNEEGLDCACVPGTQSGCYSGPISTINDGACQAGLKTCNPDGLGYGPCIGEITPVAETCNTPVDDDCDGQMNEEGAGCLCAAGTIVACYSGPQGTDGVAACTGGSALCNDQGTAMGPCNGEVLPGVEICEGSTDEDCDGEIDEAGCSCARGSVEVCYTGPANTSGVGVCVAGSRTCNAQGTGFGVCAGEVTPTGETCVTPADEDCDGVVSPACTGSHVWSERFGASGDEIAYDLAADPSGNVVVAGSADGTFDFGGPPLACWSIDAFVAKLDASGEHVWSLNFPSPDVQLATGVATDDAGNVLFTGFFWDEIDLGGGVLQSLAGGLDVFVAKLDAAGNHVWSHHYGNASPQRGRDIATDPAGNVIVTGDFMGTIDFGGGPLSTSGQSADAVYLAKLDANGNHVWSKRFHLWYENSPFKVATDASGDVLFAGYFDGTIDLGGGSLAGVGLADAVVAKYDAGGGHLWSKAFPGPGYQQAQAVATDAGGNVLIAGVFTITIDLGGGPLTTAGDGDIFVAKLDTAGNHVWSKRFGDANDQSATSVATDAAGNVIVTGELAGTVDFGGGSVFSPTPTMFVVKLDPAGNYLWSELAGDNGWGPSLAIDPAGYVLLGGAFEDSIDFGGGLLTSAAEYDVFVAKLAP